MEHVQELADGGKVFHGPKLQQLAMVYRVDIHPWLCLLCFPPSFFELREKSRIVESMRMECEGANRIVQELKAGRQKKVNA